MDENGIPVQRQQVMGKVSCLGNSSDPCAACKPVARALSISFALLVVFNYLSLAVTMLLENNATTAELAAQWEKEVFIDTIHAYNNGTLKQDGKLVKKNPDLTISFMSERSVPDELNEEAK